MGRVDLVTLLERVNLGKVLLLLSPTLSTSLQSWYRICLASARGGLPLRHHTDGIFEGDTENLLAILLQCCGSLSHRQY